MTKKYLIVNKKILPEVYEKVIKAREIIKGNSSKNISNAVKEVGISRSTYYKYKDYVFAPSEDTIGRMAVFSMLLSHEAGVLSKTLNNLSEHGVNILTINQTIPIHKKANVTLSLDVSRLDLSIEELIEDIEKVSGVMSLELLSIE